MLMNQEAKGRLVHAYCLGIRHPDTPKTNPQQSSTQLLGVEAGNGPEAYRRSSKCFFALREVCYKLPWRRFSRSPSEKNEKWRQLMARMTEEPGTMTILGKHVGVSELRS